MATQIRDSLPGAAPEMGPCPPARPCQQPTGQGSSWHRFSSFSRATPRMKSHPTASKVARRGSSKPGTLPLSCQQQPLLSFILFSLKRPFISFVTDRIHRESRAPGRARQRWGERGAPITEADRRFGPREGPFVGGGAAARRGETKSGETAACCSRAPGGGLCLTGPRRGATAPQAPLGCYRPTGLGNFPPPRGARPSPARPRPALLAPYPPGSVWGRRLLLLVAPRGPGLCPPRPASGHPVTASVPAGSCGEGRKGPAPLRSASPRPLRPRYPGTCARSGAGGQRWAEAARPVPPHSAG